MTLPALAAVAGLAVAAHLGRRGSAAKLSVKNKKRIVDLVKQGLVSEARALAVELGLDTLDLSGAKLTRATLTGADLRYANLAHAHLFRANLTNANLTGANLTGANLTDADIEEAIGINIGPTRTFIGIPYGHIKTESRFIPGRTNLRRTE